MNNCCMKKIIALLPAILLCMVVFAQNRQIGGRVVNDSTGEPLSGATVRLKGGKAAVTTDGSGNFKMAVPDNKNAALVISYTGYTDKEINAGAGTSFDVRLKPS